MGKGGPLCALAGVGASSKSTSRSSTEVSPALLRRLPILVQQNIKATIVVNHSVVKQISVLSAHPHPLIIVARISIG